MIHTVGVVIPAADEQVLLPRCLAALDRARDELARRRPEVAVHVLVVLDACTDGSALAVAAHPGVDALAVDVRQAGRARRAGCSALLRDADPNGWWLASTDADSEVPSDWLTGMLELADAGADLVLGTVRPASQLPVAIRDPYEAAYRHVENHPHVHAANLGVRAATYLAVGGWPELGTGEDVALAACAQAAAEVRIVRTARFPVRTSTRLAARAPHGYAGYLRDLLLGTDGAEPPASRAV